MLRFWVHFVFLAAVCDLDFSNMIEWMLGVLILRVFLYSLLATTSSLPTHWSREEVWEIALF